MNQWNCADNEERYKMLTNVGVSNEDAKLLAENDIEFCFLPPMIIDMLKNSGIGTEKVLDKDKKEFGYY